MNPSPGPAIVLRDSLAGEEARLAAQHLPPGPWRLVADPDTMAALGQRVIAALAATTPVVLESAPKPTETLALEVAVRLDGATGVIAVGSGTIGDLVKYAGHRRGLPYVIFATAPSMNGYVSPNASIIRAGFRTSLAAASPKAVFCDLEVLAKAPVRLIRSGLGDSLCRSTAQADWLLSHHLLDTPYDEAPFALLKPFEDTLMARAGALVEGDIAAVENLMRLLLASGEGMRRMGGSAPASQGEHMIAHTLAMMGREGGFHGEEIAVTTLAMATRQARLLACERPPAMVTEFPQTEMARVFGHPLATTLRRESAEKRARLRAFEESPDATARWQAAREAIRPILTSASALSNALAAADAPLSPADLGWTDAEFAQAMRLAPFTRNRCGFLDLVYNPSL